MDLLVFHNTPNVVLTFVFFVVRLNLNSPCIALSTAASEKNTTESDLRELYSLHASNTTSLEKNTTESYPVDVSCSRMPASITTQSTKKISVFYHNGCIQPSCIATNLPMACNFCKTQHGQLLTVNHLTYLKTENLHKINAVLRKYNTIWIDCEEFEGRCNVFTPNGTVTKESCSDEHHFICYLNENNRDSRCRTCEISEFPSKKATSTIAYNPHQRSTVPVEVLVVIIMGSVSLVVSFAIGIACLLCTRSKPDMEIESRESRDVSMADNGKSKKVSDDDSSSIV